MALGDMTPEEFDVLLVTMMEEVQAGRLDGQVMVDTINERAGVPGLVRWHPQSKSFSMTKENSDAWLAATAAARGREGN